MAEAFFKKQQALIVAEPTGRPSARTLHEKPSETMGGYVIDTCTGRLACTVRRRQETPTQNIGRLSLGESLIPMLNGAS
jgi:hypothetical protein